jgi:SAM-dependent methyltransferase
MTTAEEQVQIEAELAKRLLSAPEHDRRALYGEVYDEIFRMHLSRDASALEFGAAPMFLPFLLQLTRSTESVLEIGCGAGLMAIELARAGRKVTGVDVSQVILDKARARSKGVTGVEFEQVSGVTLPYPNETFDVAYSIEVVEHLHENDALAHFAEVRRVLRPGGRYWFLTPNGLTAGGASERFGVSIEADADVHLKVWTYRELLPVLRGIGFCRLWVPFRTHRALFLPWVPLDIMARAEWTGSRLLRRVLRWDSSCSVVAVR